MTLSPGALERTAATSASALPITRSSTLVTTTPLGRPAAAARARAGTETVALTKPRRASRRRAVVVGSAPEAGMREWDVDQTALASAVGATTITVDSVDPRSQTERAVALARSTRMPVVLAVPYDIGRANVADPDAATMPRPADDAAGTPLPAAESRSLECNDIARVSIRTAAPIHADAYTRCRATGSFVLIDEATGDTVGAGMISDPASSAESRT